MEKFNFRTMDYFLKTAELLNFTKAAEALYMTQPALSRSIRDLEEEIGVKLFKRTTRKTELTPGGTYLYNEWKQIRKLTETSLVEARKISGADAKKIRIGLIEFGGVIDAIYPVIEELDDRHPEFEIEVDIYGFNDLRQKLMDHELDLIISLDAEIGKEDNTLHFRNIADMQLYIFLSKKNFLYNRDSLDFSDLKNESFYIFSDSYSDSAKRSILDHCKREGFEPKHIKLFPNMQTLEYAVEHSQGVTIGYDFFFRDNPNLKKYPITDLLDYHLVAAWRGELTRNMTLVLNQIRDYNN